MLNLRLYFFANILHISLLLHNHQSNHQNILLIPTLTLLPTYLNAHNLLPPSPDDKDYSLLECDYLHTDLLFSLNLSDQLAIVKVEAIQGGEGVGGETELGEGQAQGKGG
jgi:hypothetical protein